MLRKLFVALGASLIFLAPLQGAEASTIMGYAPISIQEGSSSAKLHYAQESALLSAIRNASIESGTDVIKPLRWHYFNDIDNGMVACLLEY